MEPYIDSTPMIFIKLEVIDINVVEGQPKDITMSKERLKRDRQVGSISHTKKRVKRSNN